MPFCLWGSENHCCLRWCLCPALEHSFWCSSHLECSHFAPPSHLSHYQNYLLLFLSPSRLVDQSISSLKHSHFAYIPTFLYTTGYICILIFLNDWVWCHFLFKLLCDFVFLCWLEVFLFLLSFTFIIPCYSYVCMGAVRVCLFVNKHRCCRGQRHESSPELEW